MIAQFIQDTYTNYLQHMKQIIETNEYYTKQAIRSNRILAGMILYFEVAVITLYGIFVLPTPTTPNQYDQELFITVGVALLVLIGFGLSFSLGKNKIWSSLGFHLLITVITFQLYFLVSAFWTNVGISGSSKTFTWGNKFPAFLTDSNNNSFGTCGITAVQALKCSLANGISFAAISGRAGPLEAMVVSLFGTLIYELNRQLVSRYSFDFGGTITIFCFAGFFGSTISIILYHCVQKQKFKEHRMRLSSNFSTLFAAIGSLFCWVFFPFLNIDLPLSLILSYSAGLNTIFCISACVATTVSLTCIINGKLNFRDIIFSTIAGGVAVGSSAAIINTSLQALLLGVGAGVMHVALFQVERHIRWHAVVQNYVFQLYAVMGTLGGLASAIFVSQAAKDTAFTSITDPGYVLPSASKQLIGVGISSALGIVSGLILSPLIRLMNVQTDHSYYHDRAYWIIQRDGISQKKDIQELTSNLNIDNQSEPQTVYYKQMIIKIPKSTVTDRYAYL